MRFIMVKIFNFETANEFAANTYIIGKIGSECLIIDLGSTDKKIYEYVNSHHSKCCGILLTHGHFDHIRGVPSFLKSFKYDIPVYIHQEDFPLLTDPLLNASITIGNQIKVNVPVNKVEDKEELIIAKHKIQVIHTPFHTKGSVCYLFEEENALFTGDSLFKGSIGRTDLPSSKPSLMESSLKKIASLNPFLGVFPGHGDITNLEREKENNPYLVFENE